MPELVVLRIVQAYGWSNDIVRALRPTLSAYGSSRRAPTENHLNQDVALSGIRVSDPLRKGVNNFI